MRLIDFYLVLVTQRKRVPRRFLLLVTMALMDTLALGCAASKTSVAKPSGPPAQVQSATKGELIGRYERQATAVRSVNLSVRMTLTAGSTYAGVIKQYHEVNGFLVAQRPASIRVIGQAPIVGTNIFDMQSDGETFHIFIPSQHKFLTGPTNLERASEKPVENLRPQHLTQAIFWETIPKNAPVLVENAVDDGRQYYVLTVVRDAGGTTGDWEIAEKIWFDRSDLNVVRLETYEAGGKIGSDVRFSAWTDFSGVEYPREISLSRPANDYNLRIEVTKAAFNAAIPADRFVLQQPPGTDLVNLGDESGKAPQAGSNPEGAER
jgi:hypothetical protein